MRNHWIALFLFLTFALPHALADDPNSYPENRRLWGPTSATFFQIAEGGTIKFMAGPQYGAAVELQGFKPNQLNCVSIPPAPNMTNQQWECTGIKSLIAMEGNSEVYYENSDGRSNMIAIQVNPAPAIDPSDNYPRVIRASFSYDSKELFFDLDKPLTTPMKFVYEIHSEPGFVLQRTGEQLIVNGGEFIVRGADAFFEQSGGDGTLFTIISAMCDQGGTYASTGIVNASCSRTLQQNYRYYKIAEPTESTADLKAEIILDTMTWDQEPGTTFTLPIRTTNIGPDGANDVSLTIVYDPNMIEPTNLDTRCSIAPHSSTVATVFCMVDILEVGQLKEINIKMRLTDACTKLSTFALKACTNAPWNDSNNANNCSREITIRPTCASNSSAGAASSGMRSAIAAPSSSFRSSQARQEESHSSLRSYANVFSDITSLGIKREAAAHLYDEGIISGYPDGEFKGAQPVNRAEAAKFLLNATEDSVEDKPSNNLFPDVPNGQWFTQYVVRCFEKGIIKGHPNGYFKPADTVNTAEFLKMINHAFALPTELPYTYADVSNNDWFALYAGAAQEYDMFPDRTTQLDPSRPMSRFDVAIAIHQVLLRRGW